jgi:hypothetical protein
MGSLRFNRDNTRDGHFETFALLAVFQHPITY